MTTGKEIKELRHFGLIVGGVFALIGCWPLVIHGRELRLWALVLAALLILPALAFPSVLKPVHKGWMFVGHWLGWINTRILLGILFYGVVTPMGLLRRLWVKDALALQFREQADTYRRPRQPRPGTHMHHPF
jgi:polyferredoxin